MLFIGAIPKPVVTQALRVCDLASAGDVYVCCSGSFRLEQALAVVRPDLRVHSNDVSLLSCAIGGMATGNPIPFTFTGRLEFLEKEVGSEPLDRLAALAVAIKLGHFAGKSEHARTHFAHHERHAADYIAKARDRLGPYLQRLKLTSFFGGDFKDHAREAIRQGAPIFAWPPTYKGGYEQLYKLINQNTRWEEPKYSVFDPATLPEWLDELDTAGARYVVCADHALEGRAATAMYQPGRARRIYLYTSMARGSSVRRDLAARQPFKYTPVDPWQLTASSKVTIVSVDNRRMNFIKDRYLAPGLEHSDGDMRFLVFLDGTLAGGFIYSASAIAGLEDIYLLCDFSVDRGRKLSKLIAMLATGEETVRHWELRRVTRIKQITTTAFTDKPVSMKYRGIYELVGRKPGFLNYRREVTRVSNQHIYAEWWKRFAAKDKRPSRDENRPAEAI